MSEFFLIGLAPAEPKGPIPGEVSEAEEARGANRFAILGCEPGEAIDGHATFNLHMDGGHVVTGDQFNRFVERASIEYGCPASLACADPSELVERWKSFANVSTDPFDVGAYQAMAEYYASPDGRYQVMYATIYLPSGALAQPQPTARYVLFAKDQGTLLGAFMSPTMAYHEAMKLAAKEKFAAEEAGLNQSTQQVGYSGRSPI